MCRRSREIADPASGAEEALMRAFAAAADVAVALTKYGRLSRLTAPGLRFAHRRKFHASTLKWTPAVLPIDYSATIDVNNPLAPSRRA